MHSTPPILTLGQHLAPSPFDGVEVWPGDVILTRGSGKLARFIRWGEREPGEPSSEVNHGGMFSSRALIRLARAIESLWRTVEHAWWPAHQGDIVSVYRCRGFTSDQRIFVAACMRAFVGKKYGWWKLITNLVDNKMLGGRVVLRRLHFIESRPICTYSLGLALEQAGVQFDDEHGHLIPGKALQPDDADDSIARHPELWETIVYRQRVG